MVISLVSSNFVRDESQMAVGWTTYFISNRIGRSPRCYCVFPGVESPVHSDAPCSWTSRTFCSGSYKAGFKSGRSKLESEFLWDLKKIRHLTEPFACGRFLLGLAHLFACEPAGFFSTHVYMNREESNLLSENNLL